MARVTLELEGREVTVLEKALTIAQEEMEMEEDEDLEVVTRLLDRLEEM